MATPDFKPGLDVSTLTTISKADLVQMVAGITPVGDGSAAGIGGVIVMSSGAAPPAPPSFYPNSDDANPRYVRYLWIDTFDPDIPIFRLWIGSYDGSGVPIMNAADWAVVGLADDTVTTAMIKVGAVTFTRITPPTGVPGQIVIVDSAGTALTTTTLNNLLSLVGTKIPLNRLDKTNAVPNYVLAVDTSGNIVYKKVSDLYEATGATTLASLEVASATDYVMRSGATGAATWQSDTAFFADLKAKVTPLPSKIDQEGASAGQVMSWDGTKWAPSNSVVGWTIFPPVTAAVDISNLSGRKVTLTHSLTTAPRIVRAVLVCGTAEYDFLIGDEIPLENIYIRSSTAYTVAAPTAATLVEMTKLYNAITALNLTANSKPCYTLVIGTMNCIAMLHTLAVGETYCVRRVRNANPLTIVALTQANWSLKIYCMN
jgi:hypothetical protein